MKKVILPKWMLATGENSARFYLRSAWLPVNVGTDDGKQIALQMGDEINLDDWVKFEFRALSATYLGKEGYFLDFSKEGVLKKSIPLMIAKESGGARRNVLKFTTATHSRSTRDIIGYIAAARWAKATAQFSAPGINVDVLINKKLGAQEILQLSSNPPLVESVSLALDAKYEKSHPDLETWEFYSMLGREVDGEIVRLIATEILNYYHLSLVDEGADNEADAVMGSEFSNIFSQGDETPLTRFAGLSPQGDITIETNGGNAMELTKEILAALGKILSLDIKAPEDLQRGVAELQSKNETLSKQVEEQDGELKKWDSRLGKKRESVTTLIAKVDPELAKTLSSAVNTMEWDDLLGMESQYQARLEAKFPPKCQACGSSNVLRRSSVEVPQDQPGQLQTPSNGKMVEVEVNEADFKYA